MRILVRINGTGKYVKAAIEKLKEENSALRAWTAAFATFRETRVVSEEHRTEYQRKRGYRGSWLHTPLIHSVAEIIDPPMSQTSPTLCRYELGTLTLNIILPKGYEWRVSAYGKDLYAVRLINRDEYHVTGDELSDLTGKQIAAKLREANATRRKMENQQKKIERESSRAAKRYYSPLALARRISRAIAADATITLADSVAAGNCAAGTMQYAETFGVTDHVVPLSMIIERPSYIRRIVSGEDVRLKNAVIKAIERQGF